MDLHSGISAVSLFGAAVFINAFLLFLLQPMFGKMALPHLGGNAAVWTTCMLFFELGLLAGYVYAHLLGSRFRTRTQLWIHGTFLVVALASLPLGIPAAWAPPDPASPVPALLGLLTRRLAAPFILLAAGSPLLQHWFACSPSVRHRNPYALYVASNLGSAAALLFYPLVLEPHAALKNQSALWLCGYIVLVGLVVGCGLLATASASIHSDSPDTSERSISWSDRALWIALAAVPSSLLLGVTAHLTTDLAPIPLLWIIPLALYLLTFAIAFGSSPPWLPRLARHALPFLVIAVVELYFLRSEIRGTVGYALHLVAFFVCALACHLRLAGSRPAPSRLTEFYVWIAIGGAVGGAFNVLAAPVLFRQVLEYPLGIVAAAALYRVAVPGHRSFDFLLPALFAAGFLGVVSWTTHGATLGIALSSVMVGASAVAAFATRERPMRFALALGAIVVSATVLTEADGTQRLAARSFYGVYRVVDDSVMGTRRFYSGTTIHGSEFLADSAGRRPLAYYHPDGPLGSLFSSRSWKPGPWRVGVIGLGAGATAAYARAGESWTFYEIDPLVAQIASESRLFHYLSGAAVAPHIVLGDARLSLQRASDVRFDVLLVDAFSSDAIPVHLLTREALAVYRARLAADGVIAWHISNKYLDLRPVLNGLAKDAGLIALVYADLNVPKSSGGRLPSVWVAMTASRVTAAAIGRDTRWRPIDVAPTRRVWTDDFSDVLSVLR